jgi:hypothetical protein
MWAGTGAGAPGGRTSKRIRKRSREGGSLIRSKVVNNCKLLLILVEHRVPVVTKTGHALSHSHNREMDFTPGRSRNENHQQLHEAIPFAR